MCIQHSDIQQKDTHLVDQNLWNTFVCWLLICMGGPEKPGGKSVRKSLSKMFLADFADFLWSSYSFQISIQSCQTINFHEFITFNYSLFQTFCKWDLHPTGAANMYQAARSSKFIYVLIFLLFPFVTVTLSTSSSQFWNFPYRSSCTPLSIRFTSNSFINPSSV